ncbi:protein ACCELERATED CELL DEATH 6-like [Bidens hawaiensis]|uniref:protein ACCELERATED CELL DEATH 6-like n=1 Tax=Bidens hawaiensis TaxID=980011 RepID=UPI00404B1778
MIKNSHGRTVLHVAAIVGNTIAVKLLVKNYSTLLYIKDNEGHTPLDKANENGHRNVASLLVAADKETKKLRKEIEDEHWTPVFYMLKKRDALDVKINSDGYTLLHKVVEKGRNDLVKSILRHLYYDLTKIKSSDGSSVLHIAAIAGNTDAAELLVKHDKQLLDICDNEGKTPLDKATEKSHTKTIEYLRKEATKKIETKGFRQLIMDGKWSIFFNKLTEISSLKEKIDSDGNTLLHIAVGEGFYFIENIVERIGADYFTEIKNSDGSTALHIAAIVGNTHAAKILVKKNKDLLHTKDNEGKTPLDKAYENMHLHTIACLLEAAEDHQKHKKEDQEAPTVDRTRSTLLPSDGIGVDLLVNAISSKKYGE